MTQFSTGIPDRTGRRRGVAGGQTLGFNPDGGGTRLDVPGPIFSGRQGQLAQLLTAAAGTTADVSNALDQRRQRMDAQLLGEGARLAREREAEIVQLIANREVAPAEGETQQDFADRVLTEQFGDLGGRVGEGVRRTLAPSINRVLTSVQQEDYINSRQDAQAAIQNAIYESPDEAQSALDELRDIRPDLSDTELLEAGIVPALEQAASDGDRDKFNAIKSKIPEGQLAIAVAEAENRLTAFEARRLAEQDRLGSQLLADEQARLELGDISVQQFNERTESFVSGNPRLKLARRNIASSAMEPRLRALFDRAEAAAKTGDIEAYNKSEAEIRTLAPQTQIPTESIDLRLVDYAGILVRTIGQREQARNRASEEQIGQLVRGGQFAAAEILLDASTIDGEKRLDIQSDIVYAREYDQSLRDAQSQFLRTDGFGNAMTIQDRTIQLPNGRTSEISAAELREDAYNRTVQNRYGGVDPIVNAISAGEYDQGAIADQIALIQNSGYFPSQIGSALAGSMQSVGDVPSEVGRDAVNALNIARELAANDLMHGFVDSSSLDGEILTSSIGLLERTPGIRPEQALSRVATSLRNMNEEGRRNSYVPDGVFGEAVTDLPKYMREDPIALQRFRAIANDYHRFYGMPAKAAAQAAADRIKADSFELNGRAVDMVGLGIRKQDAKAVANILLSFEGSMSGNNPRDLTVHIDPNTHTMIAFDKRTDRFEGVSNVALTREGMTSILRYQAVLNEANNLDRLARREGFDAFPFAGGRDGFINPEKIARKGTDEYKVLTWMRDNMSELFAEPDAAPALRTERSAFQFGASLAGGL